MPARDAILAGLSDVATGAIGVGIAWHVVVGLWILARLLGFQPQPRTVSTLSSVPLASVSMLAWIYGNPFNGAVFALVAVLLAWLARAGADGPLSRPARWARTLGAVLIAFAWVYPHFVGSSSIWGYLYRPPLGTIPCPTLSLLCGAALIGGGPKGCSSLSPRRRRSMR